MSPESRIPSPVLPLRDEPWSSPTVAQECPVCRGWWKPWVGSRLPCHAKCLFDDVGRERIRELCRNPILTLKEIAETLGITEGMLRNISVGK